MGIITRTLRIVPVVLCFFLPNGNNTVVAEMIEISFHFKKKILLNSISHPTKCKTFEIYFQAENGKCSLSNLSFLETQTSGLRKTRVPSRHIPDFTNAPKAPGLPGVLLLHRSARRFELDW